MVSRLFSRADIRRLIETYSLDPRSLSLLRILVGLGFAITRLINLPWVEEFYTDQGSYPRSFSVLLLSHPHGPSLLHSVGNSGGVFFLYSLAILAGLAVALGYRTRYSTPVCFLFAVSVYNRCPAINPASDAEICLCLLFGTFLPWGDLWSVDHPEPYLRKNGSLRERKPYISMAVICWRIQVSAIYITAALSKTSVHWGNGSASLVSMNSDFWSSAFGRWVASLLAPHPAFSRELTHQVVLLEFLLPFLLLVPIVWLQFLALLSLIVMHVSFGLALHLEAFTPLAIACLSGFIPAAVWERCGTIQRTIEFFFTKLARFSPEVGGQAAHMPLGPVPSAFLSWAIFGVIWSCAASTGSAPLPTTDKMMEPWHTLGLQQSWGMFVPPPFQGGWYVFRGRTMRGDWVNLEFPDVPIDSLGMPAEMDQSVPTSRHVLLYNSLLYKEKYMVPLQDRIALDYRIRWERSHPDPLDRLQEVEIYRFYREYDSETGKFSKPENHYTYQRKGV